jgi:putative DNA methylase
MNEERRLIEVAFPLKQVSLDSVREKYGPRGHISGFHLWPARRPLAACRAVLVEALLADSGVSEERNQILERLGGRLVTRIKKKKLPEGNTEEQTSEETEGGILHWGREGNEGLDWFREKIRAAYGGRAPKVLDPFAGGGAIPLEAMRLGCDVTAVDINPVAWFILKCTLEYPQRLANQLRPLPEFALESREFMEGYFKAKGFKDAALRVQLASLGLHVQEQATSQPPLTGVQVEVASNEANLAWHVRAWGWWVLQQAKDDLARFYPTLNGKPTVAYLWARTVACKNCRAVVPLLKTRWLCKKDKKRVILTMVPNADKTGVVFGVQEDVPYSKGTAAQRGEAEKRIGSGTISGSGVTCPCCGTIMAREDLQQAGLRGYLGTTMTAVIVEGKQGKEYRLPTEDEIRSAAEAEKGISEVFAELPFGLPEEPLPQGASRTGGGSPFTAFLYGLIRWCDLFTPRQLLALGTFIKYIYAARETMKEIGYSQVWIEALGAYLSASLDRLVDHSTSLATWYIQGENVKHTFVRYALPITWDYAETNTLYNGGGSWSSAIYFCSAALENTLNATDKSMLPTVVMASAIQQLKDAEFDLIVTDPPYYDAIPYSDLMDLFYIWLRRSTYNLGYDFERFQVDALAPKWNNEANDGELIDDSSRFGGDKHQSKANYEDGMFRAFQACYKALLPDGRLVIVFAHKQPDAWETLVTAIIRSGFIVDASWPIQTENATRSRARASAALSSSVWLVCKKRPETARPGWDSRVLEEMQEKIILKLRDFWDAGIRGPDFVWAATGPAMEAYSKHPVVKKLNEPGQTMSVSEFLRHVRRMVADFVVGRVLSHNGGADAVSGLDDVTTYYLLHRYDFGMESAPIGPCILYAVSCNLKDTDLISRYDLLARTGGPAAIAHNDEEASEDGEVEPEEGTNSTVRLKPWNQRKSASLGLNATGSPPPPLIDQLHRLMHLWRAGDVTRVDEYMDVRGLGHNQLFHQLLQALIELAPSGSDERALIESISNHVASRGSLPMYPLGLMD